MKTLALATLLSLIYQPCLCLQCYECNIYRGDTEVQCPTRTCPEGYNVCIVDTAISFPNVSLAGDCYFDHDNGTSYRGTWNWTVAEKSCINWDANENFTYYGHPDRSGGGLGSHNHCRNPDGDLKPWCYTDMLSHYEYCSIPSCVEHIIDTEERKCGWLDRNFCTEQSSGTTCRQACSEDLCNQPEIEILAASGIRESGKITSILVAVISLLWIVLG